MYSQKKQTHSCSPNYCSPVKQGDDSYICKYGQTHVCSEDVCGFDEVCPVSGMSFGLLHDYSDYNPLDNRTWGKDWRPSNLISDAHAEKILKKYVPPDALASSGTYPKDHKDSTLDPPSGGSRLNVDEAFTKIETLIEKLIYSDQRKRINTDWVNMQKKKARREIDVYIAECKDKMIPVNLVKLKMIETSPEYDTSIQHLSILVRDQSIVAKYSNYAIKAFKNVQLYTKEKVCPEAIALTVLYKMQQGMKVNDVIIIPLDHFLVENLPVMNDLPKLKIDKKKYTLGERLLSDMFASARKQGKTDRELAIIEEAIGEEKLKKLKRG